MKKLDDKFGKNNMKREYIFRTLNNFSNAKDIRIYSFNGLFKSHIDKNSHDYYKNLRTDKYLRYAYFFIQALMVLISEGVGFYFLYKNIFNKNIIVSEFVFYFGLITGFNGWIANLSWNAFHLARVSTQCGYYRKFLNSEDKTTQNSDINAVIDKYFDYSIVFDNVSFKYPGASEETLTSINLFVKKGEKIAIVGENGAGKTTCIKLMCGFYKPTSGNIYVNGKNVLSMSKDEHFDYISAVFQDFIILPMSIEQNITLQDESLTDKDKLQLVIEQSGLKEKLSTLKDGIKTKLVKKIFDDAVDLSGGETQKMLLARSLYKDAPILMLDEPTAALDPIAENKMYLKYNQFSSGKTSFFISHRLSSTRFCDRIIYLRDGKIAEEGTHDDLMKNKSYYHNMFQMQSNYYKF